MKLKTEELKQFKAKSATIQTNNLLPILSYLKFEPGKVTKNSLNSFLTMDITCNDSMLVDEKQLMAFVNYTQAEEINLELKDGAILITDGTKIKYTSPTDVLENFPANDCPDDNSGFPLSPEIIKDIDIASAFATDEGEAFRSHIFLGNGVVAACDNFIAFVRKHDLPADMILFRQVALIVGKLENVIFSENESYHFFTSDNCKYGFIKSAIPMVNYNPFIANLEGIKSFVINKKALISINELAINRSPMPPALGNFTCSKNLLKIEFTDSSYELSLKESLPCKGSIDGTFNFNAGIFNRMLKSLPDDILRFTFNDNKLYVTCDDNTFTALIMLIQNQNS